MFSIPITFKMIVFNSVSLSVALFLLQGDNISMNSRLYILKNLPRLLQTMFKQPCSIFFLNCCILNFNNIVLISGDVFCVKVFSSFAYSQLFVSYEVTGYLLVA